MNRRMVGATVVVGFVISAVTVYAGGCAEVAKTGGECGPTLDDDNECTEDTCRDGVVDHSPAPPGTECTFLDQKGTCNGTACEVKCVKPNCPTETPCIALNCEQEVCVVTLEITPMLEDLSKKDCMVPQCDSDGNLVAVPGDDPPDSDPAACVRKACMNGMSVDELRAPEEPCGDMMDRVCDASGKCVECLVGTSVGCPSDEICYDAQDPKCSTCHNGIKDSDETDVDCGGASICRRCTKGEKCDVVTDCDYDPASNSETQFCSQGVCCNNKCDNPCFSCSQMPEDYLGVCKPYPDGTQVGTGENVCVCILGEVCPTMDKQMNGANCMGNGSGCASTCCNSMKCAQKEGPCTNDSQCCSGKCDMNKNLCDVIM